MQAARTGAQTYVSIAGRTVRFPDREPEGRMSANHTQCDLVQVPCRPNLEFAIKDRLPPAATASYARNRVFLTSRAGVSPKNRP